ncbi:MAG: tripartite tricarboxylate transporter substrate binding protein [Burkholderiales bacterium]|nr:tripartite tricarboxylate transporter substrate binding protein [Burkholderiales bacterium]
MHATVARLVAVAALASSALPLALAQPAGDYPSRPVRLVVPQAAGGALDNVARLLSQRMAETLGQQVVIDNRPSAGGIAGMDSVAKSAPDGYTLLFAAAPLALNTALGVKLPYDAQRDFAPISLAASIPGLVAVHPSVAYRNLADLIDDSKRAPKGVSVAVPSIGTVTHLMAEALRFKTKANLTIVPYKGAGQAIADVLAGTVPVFFDALIPTGTHVAAGKLRGIAIASRNRSPLFPDVPTVVEQGHPDLIVSGFYGVAAPAGVPAAAQRRIHQATVAALNHAEVRDRLLKQGYEIHASTPEEYAAFLKNEIDRWTPIVKAAGIKVD